MLFFKSTFYTFLFFWVILLSALGVDDNKTLSVDSNRSIIAEGNSTQIDSRIAYVIPIKEQIGAPILDILRRGLKDAIKK
jgi:hypothetical protein